MELEKYTIKAQEAVKSAVDSASRNRQQAIEPVHLLFGVIKAAHTPRRWEPYDQSNVPEVLWSY